MRKLAILVCVLLLAGNVLTATPASGGQQAPTQRITGLSHEHPSGESFSYFCGKVRGVAGRSYIAIASGPGLAEPVKDRFRMPSSGRMEVSFIIDSPGRHTLKLKRPGRTQILDRESYNVPPPPPEGAAQGPFPC